MRNWNNRPYYGQFVGGVVLGSILAAAGVGIVPYAPQPNLCWYWADPYMYSRLLGLLLLSAHAFAPITRRALAMGRRPHLLFASGDYSAGRAAQRRMRVKSVRFRK